VPVTAKLSRKFYDTLGDEVANELVDWLNAVDLSYRSEFRDLFETHFGRFEARLAQQTAELRAEFGARMAALEARLVRQGTELRSEFDAKLGTFDGKLGSLETRLARQIAELRADVEVKLAEVRTELSSRETRLVRWMFGFWIGTVFTIVGAAIALQRL